MTTYSAETFLGSIPAHCIQTRSATDEPATLNMSSLDAKAGPRALCIISSVEAFPIGGKQCFLSVCMGKIFPLFDGPSTSSGNLHLACSDKHTWIFKSFCSLVIRPRQALLTFTQTWLKRGDLEEAAPGSWLSCGDAKRNHNFLPHFIRLSTEKLLKPLMSDQLF